jgi:hypothetical protein
MPQPLINYLVIHDFSIVAKTTSILELIFLVQMVSSVV